MFNRLRAVLAYHGISANTLAKNIGVTPSTLSKKMQGKRDWHWEAEIVPMIQYFKQETGATYSVETLLQESFNKEV